MVERPGLCRGNRSSRHGRGYGTPVGCCADGIRRRADIEIQRARSKARVVGFLRWPRQTQRTLLIKRQGLEGASATGKFEHCNLRQHIPFQIENRHTGTRHTIYSWCNTSGSPTTRMRQVCAAFGPKFASNRVYAREDYRYVQQAHSTVETGWRRGENRCVLYSTRKSSAACER